MSPPPPARILLIDDHRLFNDALKGLIDEQPDLTVCGQVFAAGNALPLIQQTSPQVVLLDVNLQSANGIDLGKTILASFPAVRILILTMYNQPKLVEDTRQAGLHGYLLKDTTTPDLLRAIRSVLSGHTHFELASVPASTTSSLAQRLNLTFREVEVIALIREGLTNEQIAGRIHLSVETVKTHRKNVHVKLGIGKAAELVRFAIEHGI